MLPRVPAPTATAPSGPAIRVSTIPIAIQPSSAIASGAASASMGRNSRFTSATEKDMPLRFRMGLVVNGHQVGERNLRVFLRGGEPRVAQQFLDGPQIRARRKQMRRV